MPMAAGGGLLGGETVGRAVLSFSVGRSSLVVTRLSPAVKSEDSFLASTTSTVESISVLCRESCRLAKSGDGNDKFNPSFSICEDICRT